MHMSNASHLYRGILLISKIAVPTTYFTILISIEYSKQFDKSFSFTILPLYIESRVHHTEHIKTYRVPSTQNL